MRLKYRVGGLFLLVKGYFASKSRGLAIRLGKKGEQRRSFEKSAHLLAESPFKVKWSFFVTYRGRGVCLFLPGWLLLLPPRWDVYRKFSPDFELPVFWKSFNYQEPIKGSFVYILNCKPTRSVSGFSLNLVRLLFRLDSDPPVQGILATRTTPASRQA